MKIVSLEELRRFAINALKRSGLRDEDASTIADVLITTDTFGVLSHGTRNLYEYILKIRAGGLDPLAVPKVEAEMPSWAILNGNAAFGMVCACKAMSIAIHKARETGIAYVGVHNSCHFGAAGYYANMAASEGLIGIAMSNTDPNMSIPNSSGVAIGNNPLAFAIPYRNGRTIFLDIAMSNVAALKVILAKEKGEKVPLGWLVDRNGLPTTNPSKFPNESFLTPLGSHKGYGLAVLVELLSSVLTGAAMLDQVTSWNLSIERKNNTGHAFIALDPGLMVPRQSFQERVCMLADMLKSKPRAREEDEILLPGEIEWNRREAVLREGKLPLTDAMTDSMEKLSEMVGLSIRWEDGCCRE